MKEIHPSSIIHDSALISDGVLIGPFCHIGKGVKIGKNSHLISHVTIEDYSEIGESCTLDPQVFISHHSKLDNNCHLHPNVSIGSPGFGYATDKEGVHHYIPQVGKVSIAENCRIGSGTCIDRAAMDETSLGKNSDLGALTHLAHNVKIGKNAKVYHELVIAGSSCVGDNFSTSGRAGITGHIEVGDGVHLNAHASMNNGDLQPGNYFGFPHQTKKDFENKKYILTHLSKIEDCITTKKGSDQ